MENCSYLKSANINLTINYIVYVIYSHSVEKVYYEYMYKIVHK